MATAPARTSQEEGSHVCWNYRHRAEFDAAATAFLADGVQRGARVMFLADGDPSELLARLAGLADDPERLVADQTLTVVPVHAQYTSGTGLDTDAALAGFQDAAAAAIAAGYRGLRAAADTTWFVRNHDDREAFRRYEMRVGRWMAGQPVAGLCGYDTTAVGTELATELAALHTHTNDENATFALAPRADGTLALRGEIDGPQREALTNVLRGALDCADSPELTIDTPELDFIDGGGTAVIAATARHGRTIGIKVRVTNPTTTLGRCWKILDFDRELHDTLG